MYIYIAARYGRRKEALDAARRLEDQGHTVTAEWIYGEHEAKDDDPTPAEARTWASQDIGDIEDASVFVFFAEPEATQRSGRGGRWVEFGYALCLCNNAHLLKRETAIYTVGGPEENIFSHLPQVVDCHSVDDLIGRLAMDRKVNDHQVPA